MNAWIELFQARPVACTLISVGVMVALFLLCKIRRSGRG